MFSSGKDEDHLYDFDTKLGEGAGANYLGGNKPPSTAAFRAGPGTSAGRPLQSSMGRGNAAGPIRGASRMGTAAQHDSGTGEARPMTSVSGAGYKGSTRDNGRGFDPLNMNAAGRGPAPPLAEKADNSHEDKAKEMEKGVHKLMEESAVAVVSKDYQKALEKAKEAGKAERALCKFREGHSLVDHINLDLTYAVLFNLANAYYHNKMYDESLNTYQLIVKNKNYPQSGRLRVNMGMIHYEQKKYFQAIKMFRMALDQIPATGKELRYRIMRNIGNCFIKLGQFQDAVDSFDGIMQGSADLQTSFNLLLCLYAHGDVEKIKKHFSKMITVPITGMSEDDEEKIAMGQIDGITGPVGAGLSSGSGNGETGRPDALRDDLRAKHESLNDKLLQAARLIAPIVGDESPNASNLYGGHSKDKDAGDAANDWTSGFQWVLDQLKSDKEIVASKLEIDLAMELVKRRRFDEAIDVLKSFEKKDPTLKAMAATNLSCIYFLEQDFTSAEKQADMAIKYDRYNARALVNKGNCLFVHREFQRAREMYLEAVGVEADCIEAIYNLGLVNLETNDLQEAKNAFDKLHTILPTVPEALFQIASIFERQKNFEDAAKTYERVLNYVPGDPNICSHLAQVHEKLDDEASAHHWQSESHRFYPVNVGVISWLGVWYVKKELYDEAIQYFNIAASVQPGEVKWRLMVTSCYRRLGDTYKALELYKKIHEDYPDNIEALQYLEALCRDLSQPHEDYSRKLEKLKRSQLQYQTAASRTTAPSATAAAPAPQQRQRSERPERSERPTKGGTAAAVDDLVENARSPLAAPRAGGNAGGAARPAPQRPNKGDDEDDFGGADVGSLLN